MFGKKQLKRMPMRKVWDYTIEVKEGFVPRKKGIPAVERRERGGKRICERTVVKGIYLAVEVTANSTGILCREERWEETDGAGLQISE